MKKKEEEYEKKKYITISGDEEEDFDDEPDELEKHAFGQHPDDYEFFDAPFDDEFCDRKGKKVLFWLVASVLVAAVIAIFCAVSADEHGD